MKDKKYKILAGILTVLICLFLGCKKEETVYLTSVEEVSENEEAAAAEDRREDVPVSEKQKTLVHICGAVKNPGVYEMNEEDRIYHAVEKAGGFTQDADADYLNQAQKLTDGMQIYIPTEDEALERVKNGEMPGTASGNLVNINTATMEELCTLSGIGEGKAQKIIAYRTEVGSYRSIEEIMNVEGIKQGLFDKIKDSITVS